MSYRKIRFRTSRNGINKINSIFLIFQEACLSNINRGKEFKILPKNMNTSKLFSNNHINGNVYDGGRIREKIDISPSREGYRARYDATY